MTTRDDGGTADADGANADNADHEKRRSREAILARRKRFVAAAVATMGIACGKTTAPAPGPDASSPAPCLTAVPVVEPWDGGPAPPLQPPRPCLKVAMPRDAQAADCSTPYYIDEKGLKHYKPECL